MLSDSIATPGGVKSGLGHTTGGKWAPNSFFCVFAGTNKMRWWANEAGESGWGELCLSMAWAGLANVFILALLWPVHTQSNTKGYSSTYLAM